MTIQPEEVENFLNILENERTKLTVGSFTLTKNSGFTTDLLVLYNEEEVLNKKLSAVTVEELTDLLNIKHITDSDFKDIGEGWEFVNDSIYSMEWITPYHNYPVYIKVRGIGDYVVNFPDQSGKEKIFKL